MKRAHITFRAGLAIAASVALAAALAFIGTTRASDRTLATDKTAENAATGPAPLTITIKDFEFTPHELIVPVGSKVTWVNRDEEPHKVAEVKGAFTSPPLDTDQAFTHEFDTAGTYEFFCTIHPQMTGKVVVK